ncbi:MAG TPA: DUF4231 domain-containing protein [Nitrosomonas nitrosa]|mgnify:CR=1 FL=1|jgi:hypothetical protein|uniref:Uncharacterized protein n=1 Tax=Nitrosomonas nitrosa TaxID=52442 RepID=A0A1I4QVK5_9PROT|nr:DUF4231 domain-containing protein [Nitrosomonas nitrosa]MCO6435160.1 DUF4231 domain-containing protein [Nitrosomonas nitrosa]PTR03551.1 uncharacterized protein DUF4231 [Nitrosomonas nitrosa]CAE6501921.1 conserved hypothetical protein [Nitrosomonas nitrosa]SFM44102.1 Protein of unknown function [Nitrosomonas nitrosa]HBZ29438.1 DUF4231 domain-containing protein [Nitrosomonas nitrosa]
MTNSLPKVEAFLSALQEQRFFKDAATSGSVLWYIDFYQKRAPSRRMAFRASGFILLFLSISLPFITQLSPAEWQAKVASILAWLIALVAAANAFFNWQKAWQLYTQTQLTLQLALSEWELRTAEARAAATDEEGVKLLQDALQKLAKTVSEAVSNETAQYFEGVKVPNIHNHQK